MKIAILGYSLEGKSSYEYFAAQGHELTICDQNTALDVPTDTETVLGDHYLEDLDRFDLIVRTAGLPPAKIISQNPDVAGKITTQINEFIKSSPTRNIIGVTGTKGKGTTSTMIAKMLEASGKTVRLGGNIGVPPLSFINELDQDSWVVLELSSYQLIDLKASPRIAVCLLTLPEHLDWHADLDEYIQAKAQLFVHQVTEDIAIYYAASETSRAIAANSPGRKIPYFADPGAVVDDKMIKIDSQTICSTDDLKLLGQHNWQNACAAVTAVWQAGFRDTEALRSVLTSFSGLPHRIEFVREIDGVRYYNDSFASGLAATEAAVKSIEGTKVMILGGFDRNINIDSFGSFAKENETEFRKLLLIGQSAKRLAGVLDKAGFTNYELDEQVHTMQDIVAHAKSLAQPGDAVILSPGFASFDMFKNFEDRGLQYKEVINAL